MTISNWMRGSRCLGLAAILGLLALAGSAGMQAQPAAPQAPPSMEDLIKTGFDHVYSLDYDQAEMVFSGIAAAFPEDPAGYCYLAANIWLRFLNERQELEVGNFTSAAYFSKPPEKPIDPEISRRFDLNVKLAIAKAEALLAKEPRNVRALYYLGTAYGSIAAYHATAERSLWTAFRYGGRAHECHVKVLKLDPRYHDARLTVGLYDYVAGSIPWSVKWLATLIGYRGNKEEGLKSIRLAADQARFNRKDAQVIAMVLLVREGRIKEAIGYLEPLQREFPRNPLLHADLAGLYSKAGRHQDSIRSYRDIVLRIQERREHYERLRLNRVLIRLGDELIADNQLEAAREVLVQGLQASSEDSSQAAAYHLRLGQVCDLLRDRPAAVAHYEKVLGYPKSGQQEQARKYMKTPYNGERKAGDPVLE